MSRSTLSAKLVIVGELVHFVGYWMMTGHFLAMMCALFVKSCTLSLRRLETSAALWADHIGKLSTHVLTPPRLGALREVARDNMYP